jgi:hypothetical protein
MSKQHHSSVLEHFVAPKLMFTAALIELISTVIDESFIVAAETSVVNAEP